AGWVITQIQQTNTCGGYMSEFITGNLTNGISVCANSSIPAGWWVTSVRTTNTCGGYQAEFLQH
ncbi:hypothetical protein, partial [Kitasatospora sp. NPDC094011]|uniref:hypothetical protein n=1 Tax=Kitasatospora sp. NPDC094011 TaxID=3364090 RepID=UPI0037F8D1FC